MSTTRRDATSVFRNAMPCCVLCGRELRRGSSGRRRLYCGPACRQHAYRLREAARCWRGAEAETADPREVARLLAAVLHAPTRR
jgi:hypothetical protein